MTTTVTAGLLDQPGSKNILHNGNFEVNQRAYTSTALANFDWHYAGDRWGYYNDRGTGAATLSRSTDVPTLTQSGTQSTTSLNIAVTTAMGAPVTNNEAGFIYGMEGYDLSRFWGKDVTLSFWVKSNLTGTYSLGATNTADRSIVNEYTVNTADTWEKKIITIPMGDVVGGTWVFDSLRRFRLYFGTMAHVGTGTTSTIGSWTSTNNYLSANQVNLYGTIGNYLRISQVQLEVGNNATEFERRPPATELALCQRYYYAWSGNVAYAHPLNTATQLWRHRHVDFPVTMRATPTCSLTATAHSGTFAANFPTVENATNHSASCRLDVSAESAYARLDTLTASADI